MKVRAKIMAFDGMKRVRPGQICEVDDKLIKRDADGHIVKPLWCQDINDTVEKPALETYSRGLPEQSASVFKAEAKTKAPSKRKSVI